MLVVTVFYSRYIIQHICSKEYYDNVKQLFGQEATQISYRDFYDHELFEEIKQFIGEESSTYRVGCLGFFPAIASVNGFYTVDAYSTNYPLEYKYCFREVIEGELDKHEGLKSYFDNWGSRCYLFSSELGFDFFITKDMNRKISDLDFNIDKLKSLGCSYIFSAVEVENATELGMCFQKHFTREQGAIEIYLYRLQ